jgi:hypothetical protein
MSMAGTSTMLMLEPDNGYAAEIAMFGGFQRGKRECTHVLPPLHWQAAVWCIALRRHNYVALSGCAVTNQNATRMDRSDDAARGVPAFGPVCTVSELYPRCMYIQLYPRYATNPWTTRTPFWSVVELRIAHRQRYAR